LLERGKQSAVDEGLDIFFVRGDARQTGLTGGQFRWIFILGSSFGYFVDEHENNRVLTEVHRLLSPGGVLLLDLPFRKYVEENFSPVVHHTVDDKMAVTRHRALKDGVVYACEQITSTEGEVIRVNRYCTRLYHPGAIAGLLEKAGFTKVAIKSDYMDRSCEGDFGSMTKRIVVTAQK
jgi:ubiquinone/menaquinone biosynthesis C-methylase UbiE